MVEGRKLWNASLLASCAPSSQSLNQLLQPSLCYRMSPALCSVNDPNHPSARRLPFKAFTLECSCPLARARPVCELATCFVRSLIGSDLQDPKWLEDLTGLTELQRQAAAAAEHMDLGRMGSLGSLAASDEGSEGWNAL